MRIKTAPPERGAGFRSEELAPGVLRLAVLFANVYLVGDPGGAWVLVDTGLPWFANRIRRRAEERFGRPPAAIVLTHGHFDHSGNVEELAALWSAPVYAHRLELPFLTGRSDYPPFDPTVGGVTGLLARSFPNQGIDLKRRVHPLPADGLVPGLPGWRWIHTPGHTAGHVALFRDGDRTLLAGDAVVTVNLDSALSLLIQRRSLSRPPSHATSDWWAARSSVRALAELRPQALAAGHGRPMRGGRLAAALARFAASFSPPRRGRYVERPARSDEHGLLTVPPPVPDPLPRQLLVAGLAAGALFALAQGLRERQEKPPEWREKPRRRAG
jgi:glyoxylase-like metal-dependent hydrolase (beta-lactamase superfamily II)